MSNIKQYMHDELEYRHKKLDNEFFKKYVKDVFNKYDGFNISDLEMKFYNDIFKHDDNVSFYVMITDNQNHYCNIGLNSKYDFLKCVSCFKNENFNLYFSPAMFNGWRLDVNVSYLDCLYVDIDNIEGYENVDFTKYKDYEISNFLINNYDLDEFILPDWVIASGHGLHLYYLVDELDFTGLDNYGIKNKYINYLIYHFKSDSSCSNLSRVLRCPFSNNVKNIDDIRQTKLFKINKYNDLDIHRLEFAWATADDINTYILINKKERSDKAQKTRQMKQIVSDSIVLKDDSKKSFTRKKSIKENVAFDGFDMRYITYPKQMKWRYKNIVYDLHNYFVRRRGNIVGYRNKFIFIMSLYLKRIGLKDDDCFEYISKYITDDFQTEAKNVINSVYSKNYKIKNKTIAEWLDFTDDDMKNAYSYYTDEKVLQQMKLNSDKQNQKKKELRGFQKNKDFQIDIIKNNPDMTGQELADFLCVSIRTVRNLQKQIKEAV